MSLDAYVVFPIGETKLASRGFSLVINVYTSIQAGGLQLYNHPGRAAAAFRDVFDVAFLS